MRGLFLFLILSFAAQADPALVTIPYHPVLSDELTMKEDAECKMQARLSAKAFQNARLEISLADQLAVWDKFMESKSASAFSRDELAKGRKLIEMAYKMAGKFKDVKPNEYGDYVYSSCAGDKLSNPAVKF